MRLGIHVANFTLLGGPEALGPTLAATARAADEGGVTTLTLMDHWFQMEAFATSQDPMLEGYTSLGFVAAQTQRVQLGIGAAWCEQEHLGLGVPFPSVAERFERLEEALIPRRSPTSSTYSLGTALMWGATRRRWRRRSSGSGTRSIRGSYRPCRRTRRWGSSRSR